MKNEFQKIRNTINDTTSEIFKLDTEIKFQKEEIKKADTLQNFLDTINDKSTEFSALEGFIADNKTEISIIHKQWDIEIYSSKTLEEDIDIILPYIHYEIIYQENANNTITFFNTHKNLNVSDFFEITENKLILHVGLHIEKSFNGAALIVSNAKVRITLQTPFTISN